MRTTSRFSKRLSQSGSLLVELSLVLGIVGVLAVGTFSALSSAQKSKENSDGNASLVTADRAIRAFILKEKRVPCPDMTGSGFEGNGSGTNACAGTGQVGGLPYLTLNLEKPVLPDGLTIRYGVWRSNDTDMAVRSAPVAGNDPDPDGSHRFYASLLQAAKETADTGRPYVAGADSSGKAVNCGAPSSYPVVVMAVAPRGQTGNCFAETAEGASKIYSIGRQELLGWFHVRAQ